MKAGSSKAQALAFALLLLSSLSAFATAGPESSLDSSLRELEGELATLEAQLAQAKSLAEQGRNEKLSRLEALAASCLEDELASAALDAELAELEAQHRQLESQRKSAESQRAQLANAIARFGQSLSLRAREQPGREERADKLEALLASLAGPNPQFSGEAASALAAIYRECLLEAQSIQLGRARLHNAKGELEDLEVLQLGSLLFAYRGAEGRIGLALASPREARGWRWSEDLPSEVKTSIAALFDAPGSSIFVDLTRSLRPQDLKPKDNWEDRLKSGGWVMIPLAVLALVGTLLVLERAFALALASRGTSAASAAAEAIRTGALSEALRFVESARGFVPAILRPLLSLKASDNAARESAVQAALIDQAPHLQSRLGAISVLAAIAPLLGLLGTVTGIIQTFGVIQRFGNANPGLMAGGISEALITTAAGLTIAIPLLLGHSVLAAWADKVLAEGERQAALTLQLILELEIRQAQAKAPTKIDQDPSSSLAAEPAP
jgi:biopolymer transport protein ExbB